MSELEEDNDNLDGSEDLDNLKKKNKKVIPRKSERILSTLEHQKMVTDIVDWLMNGFSKSYIVDFYVRTRDFSKRYVVAKYTEALEEIRKRANVDYELVANIHLNFYEKIYQYFEEVNEFDGKRKALLFKEKLLGLHKEETNLEINNTTNIEINNESNYELNKLNLDEQKRIETYLQKINKIK